MRTSRGKNKIALQKGFLLITCLILSTYLVKGQNTFIKTLGGTGDDIAYSAIETNDGNYLLIGSTTSFGSGGSDGYISKINGSAKEVWDKAIGGTGNDVFQSGIQLANRDFILVGHTTSFGNGGQDFMVTKVDNFGNVIWTRTFGGSNDENAFKAIETSDGNILVAGHTTSFGSGSLDAFVVKLNMDGDELWSKTYGTSGNDWFNGQGLIEDSNGHYVLAGAWLNSSGSQIHDGFLMKLDVFGNIILMSGIGGGMNDGLNGFLRETANGYQNIGISWSWNGPDHEIWMTDLTTNGNVNWSKTFGLPGENIRIGFTQFTDDGNYLISGYEFTQHTNATGNALLLKVSQSGDIIWSKSYGDFGIETLDVVFETDQGLIAFGKTTSYGEGGNDIFVVRADQFGTVSGCSENITLTNTDVNTLEGNPNFLIENLTLEESQDLVVSDIENIENTVCDGCNATDLTAGLFCETAPIICSIDCLDGFTGTLPNDFILPQPDPLCDGGIPNNVSWFAFVAGSNTIDLSIIPTNCTTIYDDTGTSAQTIGIQAGVYEDCSFENSFICQTDGCLDLIAETINISSNDFEIGQVYYLFVDGCGGSICDYEVVVNSAQQAFEMDEITTISNDLGFNLEEDTLCQGTAITFTLDDFDQSVNFNWVIDPPTALYPSGIHPVNDTNAVVFHFEEEGCFDIHVYAYNECDNSETRSFSVCVEPLADEVFSDIYVCQECFPITLISPESGCIITEGGGAPTVLIEDPNGDGVPGWLGTSTINGPGLDSNVVVNVYGCAYKQYVNVIEIPLSPREQVDHYFCLADFPVTIDGQLFSTPGETRNITLEGGAASGCDSLMSITAHEIDFFGFSNIGNCEAGEVELAFVLSTVTPESYDSITYVWYDENGDIVTDGDAIDSTLIVMGVGSYSVQVIVHVQGSSCPQTFGPFMIDVDNLSPELPTVSYAPNEICVSELVAQIYVANQGLGENYDWSLTPNLPVTFGQTTDTIFVDFSSGLDFEFCVFATNGCGSSMEICDDVVVHEAPDSEFLFDSEICIDSFIVVEYAGLSGTSSSSVFNWDFDGGVILNGIDANSGGPFEIGFSNAGDYTIGLILEEAGCESVLTEHQVTIVEPFDPPMIECQSDVGSVTFSWDDSNVTDINVSIMSGQSQFELSDGLYVITGLGSEEDVVIQIEFNSGDICGGVILTENCTSQPCPDAALNITLSEQDICIGDNGVVDLTMNITGDNSGSGNWVSPYIINDNQFDIDQAGVGDHLLTYLYVINDCSYTVDTMISIFDTPTVEVNIMPSYCEEMGPNLINIVAPTIGTIYLDGVLMIVYDSISVTPGEHNVMISNTGGCSSEIDFTIDDYIVEDLVILGEANLIEGSSGIYSVQYNSNVEDLMLIWTLDGDTICTDCNEVMIQPDSDVELCLEIVYGEGCSINECLFIEMKEKTQIFVPNAFSPNNDNVNDQFTINSNSQDVFINEIMIFDRWGEMVFNQKGFNVSEESRYWDGSLNGRDCVPGVYVYIISYLDEENLIKRISGDLTLVR